MLNVVFFGNSESVFSRRHFDALLATPCHLAAVVDVPPSRRSSTNPADQGVSFVEAARRRGVPVFEPARANQPDFVAAIANLSPDLFVAVGYVNILKEAILAVPRCVAANFHASLLPDYRGLHPVFRALRHGERWAGLTVHVMDPGIDTGDILYQVRVRTRQDDTVAALYDRIMARSIGLVARLLADAVSGQLRRTPQPREGGSYFSALSEADFRLDWSWEAEKLRRWIASTPGQCFCSATGQRLYLTGADVVAGESGKLPGALVKIGRRTCTIATACGGLRLHQARPEDGAWQPMSVVCHRLGLEPGDRLA